MLRFFVAEGLHTCFAAALVSCYDLVRPDVVMELAWMNGLMPVCMPFMIQSFRDLNSRVETLMSERKERAAREAREGDEAARGPGGAMPQALQGMLYNAPLALEAPAQLVGQGPMGYPGAAGMDPAQMGGFPQQMGGQMYPGM